MEEKVTVRNRCRQNMHDITAHHTEIGLFAHDDDEVGGQKRMGCVSMTFLSTKGGERVFVAMYMCGWAAASTCRYPRLTCIQRSARLLIRSAPEQQKSVRPETVAVLPPALSNKKR